MKKTMMAQTFGTRTLPPAEALPQQVADALAAYAEAQGNVANAQTALSNARRIELPRAQNVTPRPPPTRSSRARSRRDRSTRSARSPASRGRSATSARRRSSHGAARPA
jgi:hypothetical protein